MTTPLAVQLYSLGAQPATDPSAVLARLAELGFAGVEPVLATVEDDGLREWLASMGAEEPPAVDVAALKRAMDEHGLVAWSSHAQLPEGPDAARILDEQELLGCKVLIVPAVFNPEAKNIETFDDLERLKRLAERFDTAAELARARGIRLGYHNHFWELSSQIDGRSGLETFFDLVEADIVAEVDVYWSLVGGRDPRDLVTSLGERVVLLHVKDGDGQFGTPNTALGEGVVDLRGVLAAATSAAWHVIELEGLDEEQVWPVLEQSRRWVADLGAGAVPA